MYEDYFIAHAMNNMITFGLIKIGKFMLRIISGLLRLLCTCAWRKFPSSAGLMRGFSRQHIEKVASGCSALSERNGTLLWIKSGMWN